MWTHISSWSYISLKCFLDFPFVGFRIKSNPLNIAEKSFQDLSQSDLFHLTPSLYLKLQPDGSPLSPAHSPCCPHRATSTQSAVPLYRNHSICLYLFFMTHLTSHLFHEAFQTSWTTVGAHRTLTSCYFSVFSQLDCEGNVIIFITESPVPRNVLKPIKKHFLMLNESMKGTSHKKWPQATATTFIDFRNNMRWNPFAGRF